jgi:signal transduction histidine kinase
LYKELVQSIESYNDAPDQRRILLASVGMRMGGTVLLWLLIMLPSRPSWTIGGNPAFHILTALCLLGFAFAYWQLLHWRRAATVVIALHAFEVLAVTLLVWVTGTLTSPFALLYFLLLVGTSIHGNTRHTIFIFSVVFAFYGIFLLLHATGLLPDFPAFRQAETNVPIFDNNTFLSTTFAFIGGVFILIIALIIYLARQLRLKADTLNAQLIKLKDANNALVGSFHDMESMMDRMKSGLESVEGAHNELVKTEKMATMARVAAGTIHELSGPLSSIISEAELLLMAKTLPSDAKIKETLKRVLANTARIQLLMQNLGDSVRAADHRRFEILDLNMIVTRATSLISYEMRALGLQLQVSPDPSEPKIWGNSSQVEQLILSLLINSSQSCEKEKGVIGVETRTEGDKVYLTVTDNGTGVERQHLPRIFEPFFTTKPQEKHLGLGLYIVSGIVDSHKGMITVDSQRGSKTQFTIVFPKKTYS